jgi:glycosyltransferase involved in cell wall biosynthesis
MVAETRAVTTSPLVAVLTPVYNGERYLSECIDSVLHQTYDHWKYVIVDNASNDRTAEIAHAYAARDPRIHVYTNETFVPVVANYNATLRHLPPDAAWCKYVSADDMLLPPCLEAMVALAAERPSVGLIAAYQVRGSGVALTGLPYPSPVTSGRCVGRMSLLGALSVFGNPTAHMLRADLVRRRRPFYDESMLHADEASCYDVLRDSDFGFVHQVLTYQRTHRGTVTYSIARRLNTYMLDHVKMLQIYGPVYLTPDEYRRALDERMQVYYKFLARALLTPARREILAYHREGLGKLGLPVPRRRLVRAMLEELGRAALTPRSHARKLARLVRAREHESEVAWREWWAPTGFERIRSVPADACVSYAGQAADAA